MTIISSNMTGKMTGVIEVFSIIEHFLSCYKLCKIVFSINSKRKETDSFVRIPGFVKHFSYSMASKMAAINQNKTKKAKMAKLSILAFSFYEQP